MPSIRKRLKKLTSGKKSKSTSDLDNIGEHESQPGKDDDTHSYASEAVSERTDASFNESTFSYASNSEDGKKKKKRKLKVSLTRKKKKDVLVKDPSGNVVFRSMSMEHDPRGDQQSNRNNFDEECFLKTEEVELSKSVESNVSKDELSEADSWRMSGLLENVNRTSNTSLNDNLLLNFEERRRKATKDVNAESTPIKGNSSPEAVAFDEVCFYCYFLFICSMLFTFSESRICLYAPRITAHSLYIRPCSSHMRKTFPRRMAT